MSRLKQKYKDEIRGELQKAFGYTNPMLIPGLKKIVISMGMAEASKDKNALQSHLNELGLIAGQKAIATKARISISNFKSRKGQIIGAKVTLRGVKMYDFLYRFCNIVAPRIRDFQGFEPKADGRGNLSFGIDSQEIFPEINLDNIKRTQGLNVTLVTSALTDEECIALLRLLGIPFKNLPICVVA